MAARTSARSWATALSGQTAAVLLNRYEPAVRRYVRRRYGWLGDVSDLLQVARLAICEGGATHDKRRNCSERTWVWRVVRWRVDEAVAVEYRQRERQGELDDDAVSNAVANGHSDPDRALDRQTVLEGMALLEARETVVINARLRMETFSEIARVLGISITTTHRSYQRAVRVLQQYVEDGDEPEPKV